MDQERNERMQWDYHIIVRARQFGVATIGTLEGKRGGATVISDFHPDGETMLSEMKRLGREGWELVGISTRASLHNSPMTSEELWVFKRPIQEQGR